MYVVFYNKLSWFVSELPENISQTWWSSVGHKQTSTNLLIVYVSFHEQVFVSRLQLSHYRICRP